MIDETDENVKLAADRTLTLFALSTDMQRGAMIGATISCAAALAGKTPVELLEELKDSMPDDELWSREYAERTRRKCRNASRWYRGARIEFVGRGNQG